MTARSYRPPTRAPHMKTELMNEITEPAATTRRLWLGTILTVVGSVLTAAVFAHLRFTLGVALGGALALLNYAWLQSSLRAILGSGHEKMPPGARMKLIFRCLVVGAVAYLASQNGYFYRLV